MEGGYAACSGWPASQSHFFCRFPNEQVVKGEDLLGGERRELLEGASPQLVEDEGVRADASMPELPSCGDTRALLEHEAVLQEVLAANRKMQVRKSVSDAAVPGKWRLIACCSPR